LGLQHAAADMRQSVVRPDARDGREAARARRRHPLRGNARADDDRRDRRRAHGLAQARRPLDGGAGAAARDPRVDFRRLGGFGRQRRRVAVRDSIPDAMRDLALRHRRRAIRGGGRDQACEGVGGCRI
jgi:hypothetical protein